MSDRLVRRRHQCLLQPLEQLLVGGIVAKPLLATPDQRLIFSDTRVIDIILPTQGDGDGVLFRVGRVTFEQVIGSYRDRDLLALIHVDYGQSFDLHH